MADFKGGQCGKSACPGANLKWELVGVSAQVARQQWICGNRESSLRPYRAWFPVADYTG